MRGFISEYCYLLVLHSLTKIFAIPGIRLGIGFANKELIRRLASRQIPWSVNCFAQKIGTSVINETEYIEQTINFIKKQREFMAVEISKISGFKPFSSGANYLVCKLTGGQTLGSLEEYLGRKGIIIRNCSNYHGLDDRYFRIAIKKEEDNIKLIEGLKGFSRL
jgi:threonine-phosphate decarboxylase